MDAERLLGSLVRGAMRGKRKNNAVRFLTGGKGSFLNASTLLAAVGVGWGLYETMKPKTTVPEPWPGPSAAGTTSNPPPLPQVPQPGVPSAQQAVPAELIRIVRLTISAARADGDLSPEEIQQIQESARDAGAEHLIESELRNPRPLTEIVAGPLSEQQKKDLYVLAYTIARADEGVSGAEQIYLAQLAHLLGLDIATSSALEQETIARIASESGQY